MRLRLGQSACDDGRALHLLMGVGGAGFELTSSFAVYKIVLTSTGVQRRADPTHRLAATFRKTASRLSFSARQPWRPDLNKS